MRRATNCLVTTILGLMLFGQAAWGACAVQRLATVPVQDIAGHLLVPVAVNGITGHFILDTGAQRSMVTPGAVARLHLKLDQWVATRMSGIGGNVEHPNADPHSLTLGGVALQRRTVTHDTSLTVGAMPMAQLGGEPVDGLLGRDFLSAFDLALNLKAGRLTLYRVQACRGPFLPWTQPYVAIAAHQPMDAAMVLPVAVDGVQLQALLDTGASASVLTDRGMIRLGLTPERLARDAAAHAAGVGPHTGIERLHRFASMQVGAEVLHRPMLWVAQIRVVPFVDMLLGADWLAGRRVWISFATSQVFVAAGDVPAAR